MKLFPHKPASGNILRFIFIYALIVFTLFISGYAIFFYFGTIKTFKIQEEKMKEQLLESKKQYLYDMVNNVVNDIHVEEMFLKDLFGEVDSIILTKLRDKAIYKIRKTNLSEYGYVWVNEVLNYQGGDAYAIRLIHPNIPESEGMLLSTNQTDIKGNLPYLKELNGINAKGELFFTYWFKKMNSDSITEKLSYAKHYPSLNWVIASGVYLDDVDVAVEKKMKETKKELFKQFWIFLLLLLIFISWGLIIYIFFKRKIFKLINYYTHEVEKREKELLVFNKNLEQIVETKTEELKKKENDFSYLFRDNKIVMLLINPESKKIVEANNAACDFYKYSFDELTSLRISDINTLSEFSLKEKIQSVKSKTKSYFLFKHRLKNGEIKDVEVHSERINFNNQVLLFSIVHDVSELVKTKEDLLKAKEMAEQSDRLKSSFLANMSHEIRTPLNGILGFSSLLKTEELDENEQKHFVNLIDSGGKRLLSIINDIIDISKIESGQMKLNNNLVQLEDILDYNYTFFLPECQKKGLALELFKLEEYYNLELYVDSEKLNSILSNLLKNAIKYTFEGFVKFGYEIIDNKIRFKVQDSGVGIEKKEFNQIFQRFRQTSDHIKLRTEGSGLGLAICKSYLDLMGGKIWLESEVNKGSTFYFELEYSEN